VEPSLGFERKVLENGLEVAVVGNHVVPLARIQITFRCGAIAKTPDTAGVFHGDWPGGADPGAAPAPPHPGLAKDVRLAYAADTWGMFLEDPNGRFKTSIFQKVPGLYKKEYIGAYYLTRRDGGMVSFSTCLQVLKANPPSLAPTCLDAG